MASNSLAPLNDRVFGHKPGLFLLFFTEMWERFSYYGMRALLTIFLVSEIAGGGWGWANDDALQLYAWYTGLVYLTPILGGIIADKLLGYRWAVVFGALLMTLGHGALALETPTTFYIGLGLLIAGNGFFKPNISSIVGQLYVDDEQKRDAAYTIFYMGINAGAFLGILLCGYIGEKVSWSYGFGLAGIFMLLGMVMFQLGQPILGQLGLRPQNKLAAERAAAATTESETEATIVKDRLIVIGLLSFFTIFFWWAFEQAGGSMSIFAKNFTGRTLTGDAATIYFWVNLALTIVPLAVVTYVLIMMIRATYATIPASNIAIGISFVLVWIIAITMLVKESNMKSYEVSFLPPATAEEPAGTEAITRTIVSDLTMLEGEAITLVDLKNQGGSGKLKLLSDEQAERFETDFQATVVRERQNETEIPASWFGILNSLFIIGLAPLFSKVWESRLNPSAPVKFGLGLVLLGAGFGALAVGSMSIEPSAKSAAVSIWWLVLAYLLHTMGELCVSPVGLSYVSKLAPAKLVGLMFGIWFGASAIANYAAGFTGSYIDVISEKFGLTTFFLIFTIIPIAAGITVWCLSGFIRRKMHGVH